MTTNLYQDEKGGVEAKERWSASYRHVATHTPVGATHPIKYTCFWTLIDLYDIVPTAGGRTFSYDEHEASVFAHERVRAAAKYIEDVDNLPKEYVTTEKF